MSSESARIAELGADGRLLVFSYWTGRLPDIARLHFLTVAKEMPRGGRYVLLVEEAEISASLRELIGRCKIDIIPFDLARLLDENALGHLFAQTRLSGLWTVAKLFGPLASSAGFGHLHPVRGFTPRANSLLGGPPQKKAMLSDYARVIVGSLVPMHTLYMDIDFAFVRPLEWIFTHGSFVYRWERFPFGNSALMSVTPESPIKRGALLELLAREGTAMPWILFSDENCDRLGLRIISCDRVDPKWSRTSSDRCSHRGFFRRHPDSAARLRNLKADFDAVHWHNNWKAVPEDGSAYCLWLQELGGPTV